MNALEISAMLDKIRDKGGIVELVNGQPIARNVPAQFLPLLKLSGDEKSKIARLREAMEAKKTPDEVLADYLELQKETK